MFKSVRNTIVFVTLFAMSALLGCSQPEKESGAAAAIAAAEPILSYVPADSPYVLASIAPLPDDVFDKLELKIDRILQSYEVLLQEIVSMATAELDQVGTDGAEAADDELEEASKAIAIISELSSLMSVEGLRGAGFERESRSVLYGNGLLPVLRIEVSDGALFEAALANIEDLAGQKMDIATIAGSAIRYAATDQIKVLIAILDKQVVVSVAPARFSDAQLGELLGLTAPSSNIIDSGVLQSISKQYDFNDYFVGFVDIAGIVDTVSGSASGLDAELLALANDQQEWSDVCRAEIRSMGGIAPRVVVGYTDLSAERFDSQVILELRDDIAAGLTGLTAAVPGLGGDPGGLISFGLGLDILAMRNFYEARLDALEADPFECELFAEMQAGVAQGRLALQQPTPPMVYDFRGFVGVIQNIEGLDMASQMPPTSVEGQFLLAMNNAPALVSLGTMMSPELAGLDLQADGEPVLLDLPQAQTFGGDVYVAMTDNALAMSVGDGAETELSGMLSADAEDNGLFFSFSMDAARYYAFMGEAIASAEPDAESPMSPEFRAAMQEIMLAIADIYERMSVDLRFTNDGVVIESEVTLGD